MTKLKNFKCDKIKINKKRYEKIQNPKREKRKYLRNSNNEITNKKMTNLKRPKVDKSLKKKFKKKSTFVKIKTQFGTEFQTQIMNKL